MLALTSQAIYRTDLTASDPCVILTRLVLHPQNTEYTALPKYDYYSVFW
jgi:hypothetical protein